MGIIPDPTELCNRCPDCFDVDKTPKVIKLFLSGIQTGGLWTPDWMLPPNGYWDLEADPDWPCNWFAIHPGGFRLEVWSDKSTQGVDVHEGPGFIFVDQSVDQPCRRHFTNQAVEPEKSLWYGGYACFFVPLDMAEIIESVTPMVDPDPRMECFPIADKQIVLRYAGKRDATKIYIKVDTDP